METPMPFSWDEPKSEACLNLRGFDFAYAARLFDGQTFERIDGRQDYGEVRIQALGQIDGKAFVVVYTQRGETKHIISARRARQKEWDKWLK